MNTPTTLQDAIKKFEPVLFLSRILPRQTMERLRILFALLFFITFCITLLFELIITSSSITAFIKPSQLLGLCLIFGALWVEQICLYTYHNWYYFRGLDSTIGEKGKTNTGITYDAAEIFSKYQTDATKAFLTSSFGQECIERLEIPSVSISDYLPGHRTEITTAKISLSSNHITSISQIIEQLYELDSSLQNYLSHTGISKTIFLDTVQFVNNLTLAQKKAKRWWSRDALSLTVGIGNELAYGNTPFVDRFSQPLLSSTIFSHQTGITPYTTHHAETVLSILAANSASNVLMVGEVGVGKMDIVYTVAHLLTFGTGVHALHGHHIVVVDIEKLFSSTDDTKELQEYVIRFFDEALLAGNITMVIPSLHTFITKGEERGLMITDILEKYLSHPALHIIAIDTPHENHTILRNYKSILRHFEHILIEPANLSDTLMLLIATTQTLEQNSNIRITYLALLSIIEAAERYLTDGIMPDRAIALLKRIFDTTTDKHITREVVTAYISNITGIPIGPLTNTQRTHLLSLERTLATEVIGQPHAVKAVADTIRRTRIDIARHDKPRGSFLFLGPTGVGKTALAKALAAIDDQTGRGMVRFDMSEFSHSDALGYLIGDYNGTGMLTDQLRDHPFSVILFDEFEKAHPSIHDLFLQILDEGYFTSTHGERVNARNTIIIATSNAASTLISRTKETRMSNPVLVEEITRHLIDTQVFRPELLNRFDEIIIFEPLDAQACRYIIQKNLFALAQRLKNNGYTLDIADDVVELLLSRGFSTEFGARPLERAIKDLLEADIAKQIIAQNIQPGGTIKITRAMLTV